MRKNIDRILPTVKTFDEFLEAMRQEGYEVVQSKKILKFRAQGQERFTRSRTLGVDYTLEALQERARADGRQVYFISARDNLGLEPLVQELWQVCESTARNEPIVRLEGPSNVEEEEFPEIEVIYTRE